MAQIIVGHFVLTGLNRSIKDQLILFFVRGQDMNRIDHDFDHGLAK